MAKKVAQALSAKNPRLGRIMQHIQQLKLLNDAVMTALEAPLKDHCHVANFDNRVLTIQADSAVWATQLQFISDQLRFSLQQQMPFSDLIRAIKVQVRPAGSEASQKPLYKMSQSEISIESKEYLSDFADSLEDAGLKEAFMRLAKK